MFVLFDLFWVGGVVDHGVVGLRCNGVFRHAVGLLYVQVPSLGRLCFLLNALVLEFRQLHPNHSGHLSTLRPMVLFHIHVRPISNSCPFCGVLITPAR